MGGKGSGRKDNLPRGGGRPATGIKRVSLIISCTLEEKDQIRQKAEKAGLNVSQYIKQVIL